MSVPVSNIADMVTATLNTYDRGKWDSQGIAQLYPGYEIVRQFVQGARIVRDTSFKITRNLEISAPSSYQHATSVMPVQTSTNKLLKQVTTPLVKMITHMTFSEDEEALQGKSPEQILDIIQVRTVKFDRDFWEGLEHDLLSFPSSSTQEPDQLRGIPYWVTDNTAVTDLDMHGGNDPSGHTDGAGGITKAEESRWPNAVGEFSKISQQDYFDKISQFLNRVRTMSVVPHPTHTPDVPNRVIYNNEPIQRGVERFQSANNENIAQDAGVYRTAPMFRTIPMVIWHAASSPDSPVQDSVGTTRLIDWAAMTLTINSKFDQKITGPIMLPDIPGQMVVYKETWAALDTARRDRHLLLTTATSDLQPSSA